MFHSTGEILNATQYNTITINVLLDKLYELCVMSYENFQFLPQ